MPHLRILRLMLVGVDWRSSRLTNLVDLSVHFPVKDPHRIRHASISDVCDALAFMTRLERLHLRNVLATVSAASNETHRAPHVKLPALVELMLEGPNNHCNDILSRLIMPSLRSLDIEQHSKTFPSSPIRLHPSSAPELQSLRLENAPLDWTSPFPQTLLHLTINNEYVRRQHYRTPAEAAVGWYFPELDMFAQRLRATQLQTLILIHATPTVTQTTAENMRINMPDLKVLEIKGSTAAVFTVANVICLPHSSSKCIQLADERGTVGLDPPSILTGLVTPFDSLNYLPHAISLVCDDSKFWNMSQQLQLWRTPQDWFPQDQRWPSGSRPELSIEIHSPAQQSIMDTKSFTELLLTAVESLSLQWQQQTTMKSVWRTWLSRARAVKLLRLRTAYTAGVVIQAMVPEGGGAADVLFPSLETLVLCSPEFATNSGPAEMLIACASARLAVGCPIREVRLPKDAPWVDDLRAVVPVITVGTVDGCAP
ncbi:hypothetical protein FA95DRAFT_1567896 [Auriscalpium vulgare]|uniref:Uncharacterized protein n=1 Tax=Auriscalpium vulgare TaxID=40419 RepID=A0ACB8R3G5_9AGAM|nr:hypothetical protein FA95DRAFT_1567896 [Auriscalpium vulgare]